jgi:hypothetical protein
MGITLQRIFASGIAAEQSLNGLLPLLLPNWVARGSTRHYSVLIGARKSAIKQHISIFSEIEQNGEKRISSAVLSTTQPPLRGREGMQDASPPVARYVTNGMP